MAKRKPTTPKKNSGKTVANKRSSNKTDNLTPWKKGQSGNPKGRPKNRIKQIAEKVGVDFSVDLSKADVMRIIASMLEMSLRELKEIVQDQDCPVFMVNIASAIVGDIKDKRMQSINVLFDRFYGTAKNSLEISGGIENSDRSNLEHLTTAELKQWMKLKKKMKSSKKE